MRLPDALALLAIMQAAWPQGDYVEVDSRGDVTLTARGQMYAADLQGVDPGVGTAAVQSLRRSIAWHGGPSPAELLRALEDAQREAQLTLPALGPPEEFVSTAPEDVRALLDDYFAHFGRDEEARGRLGLAIRNGHRGARIEAGRLVAQRQIEAEQAGKGEGVSSYAERSQSLSPFPYYRCPGIGQRVVLIYGVRCCRVCHSPSDEGCSPKREEVS
jgi:hypothetical protein